MNSNRLTGLKNSLTVGFIALLVALAAFSFSLWQTPSYKSTLKLLAVFNQSNIDTYTASKTANYITGILGEVIYSDSFIDSVYKSGNGLVDALGQGSEQRQKSWKKTVKTQILDNRGIIIVDVYGNDKYQTNALASAIGSVIVSQHGLYDGSQDRVAIRMIDRPSVYENWSDAKVLGDTGLGLIAGLLIGLALIVIFPNHKLFEFRKKNRVLLNFPVSARPANNASRGNSGWHNSQSNPAAAPIREKVETEFKPLIAPTDGADQRENAPNRISNPWLDQYYEENLNDRFDQIN